MGRIEARLEELGLVLPAPMKPPGNFKLVKVHAGIGYIAGHTAIDGSTVLVQGGDAGRHARSGPGQGPSPFNVPVVVDAIVAVDA